MFHSTDKSFHKSSAQTGVAFSAGERLALLGDIARIGLLLGKSLTDAALPLKWGEKMKEAEEAAPLERMRGLAEQWSGARSVLPAAAALPDAALRQMAAAVPAAQARGGQQMAQELARRPAGASVWLAASRKGVEHSGNRGDKAETDSRNGAGRITESRLRADADTPANRFIATALTAWRDEARTLAALADFCDETELAQEMIGIAAQADRWRRHPAWRERRTQTAAQTAAALANVPRWPAAHRALAGVWRAANRGLRFDWQNSLRTQWPALEAWRLYEIWCYLQVAEVLLAAEWRVSGEFGAGRAETNNAASAIRVSAQGVALSLAKGRRSELHFARGGERLTLTYQTLFPSAAQSQNFSDAGFCVSRSHAMQPDICLTRGGAIFLLDPKFRAYDANETDANAAFARADSAMQDDINKMHAYRDAIVRNGKNVVTAAWCLFPGGPNSDAPPVIAFPPAVPERPFGAAGIGAVCLRPGQSAANLRHLLESWSS